MTEAFHIEPMKLDDLDEIMTIEQESFSIPWSRESFEQELKDNKLAVYIVAREAETGRLIGYAGMWHVVTEGHITNVAVRPDYRGRGAADALMAKLIETALERGMIGMTLEVRMGNKSAMGLYAKHGFKAEGIRKNYYSDTKEDAVVMWRRLPAGGDGYENGE